MFDQKADLYSLSLIFAEVRPDFNAQAWRKAAVLPCLHSGQISDGCPARVAGICMARALMVCAPAAACCRCGWWRRVQRWRLRTPSKCWECRKTSEQAAGRAESCRAQAHNAPSTLPLHTQAHPPRPRGCLPFFPPPCRRAQIVQFVRCLVWEVVRLHHFESALVPRVKRHLPVGVAWL